MFGQKNQICAALRICVSSLCFGGNVFEACISKTIKLTNERRAHPNIDQPVDQSQAWNFPKLPIVQVSSLKCRCFA